MIKVALIGWRGMVGSVLLQRMQAEEDFKLFEPLWFSTSQAGQRCPEHLPGNQNYLLDAYDLQALQQVDIILTCQGGAYTEAVYSHLREQNWHGFWIDAASTLRLSDEAIIALDPVNGNDITHAIDTNCRTFVGGNCTVSLLLMAISGLLKTGHVEWVNTQTYQAISGAGAQALKSLLTQNRFLSTQLDTHLNALTLAKAAMEKLYNYDYTDDALGMPLALNLLPWIDTQEINGQTREEAKAIQEANKILKSHCTSPIQIDGTCVRVPVLRCHSQAVTIKLNQPMAIDEVEHHLKQSSPWTQILSNTPADSLTQLTPVAINDTLNVAVGRIRHLNFGKEYINLFTTGDQLLWGAAEPLRRVLNMIINQQ